MSAFSSRPTEALSAFTRLDPRKVPHALFSILFPDDCRICSQPLHGYTRVPVCRDCLTAPAAHAADYYCSQCKTPFENRYPLDLEGRAAERAEVADAWAAVGRLPADRRRAIVLRFVDEMSTSEIAGVLGRSEGAVRVLIHRALRTVARELGSHRADASNRR